MSSIFDDISKDNLIDLKAKVSKALDEKKESFYTAKKTEMAKSILAEALIVEEEDPNEADFDEEEPNMDVDIDPFEFDLDQFEKEIWDDELAAEFEDDLED